MKKAVYIDMDGTLARFHDADKIFIEAMWTPGFYVNLKPFENLVDAVKLFIKQNPDVDVYVLSAVLDTDPPFVVGEKNAWLDKYLPEIDKEHRIFTRAGDDKSQYIDLSSKECFLLDDFNKNLYEFEDAGGISIKFHNDVNHRGLGEFGGSKGNLWEGAIVHYDKVPEVTCMHLEGLVGKIKDFDKFVIEDAIFKEYVGSEETVKVPNGINEIEMSSFWRKQNLKRVELPDSLKIIGPGAFEECTSLTDVNLPSGLQKIQKAAFRGCESLEKINIPSSVSLLHNNAFDWCENLKAINVDAYNDDYFSVAGLVYSYGPDPSDRPALHCCPCGISGAIELSEGFEGISTEAFANCTKITQITLPDNVHQIGDGAFLNCSSLESIKLPNELISLGSNAFEECNNLKSVVIPDSLASMGNALFDGCKNLNEVVISDEALVNYCENFGFLDSVYLTPCYKGLKERYENLVKNKAVDSLIEDANSRCNAPNSNAKDLDKEFE